MTPLGQTRDTAVSLGVNEIREMKLSGAKVTFLRDRGSRSLAATLILSSLVQVSAPAP